MNTKQLFGHNLKRIRLSIGWTQDDVAIEADIYRNRMSDWERGTFWPRPATIDKLATAMGVEPYEFFLPIDD